MVCATTLLVKTWITAFGHVHWTVLFLKCHFIWQYQYLCHFSVKFAIFLNDCAWGLLRAACFPSMSETSLMVRPDAMVADTYQCKQCAVALCAHVW